MSATILHFYFLAAPDFVIGPDADYSVRNVVGIIQAAPDIAKKVVQMRHIGARMLEHLAGRAIHPTFSQAGGVSKPMTETERKEMLPLANELLEFSKSPSTSPRQTSFPSTWMPSNPSASSRWGIWGPSRTTAPWISTMANCG